MKKLAAWIILHKMYMDRARQYIGYAQFFMLVYLVLKDKGVKLTHPFLVVSIGLVVFIVVLDRMGWLERKTGLFAEELKAHSDNNPRYFRMMTQIDELHDFMHKTKLKDNEKTTVRPTHTIKREGQFTNTASKDQVRVEQRKAHIPIDKRKRHK